MAINFMKAKKNTHIPKGAIQTNQPTHTLSEIFEYNNRHQHTHAYESNPKLQSIDCRACESVERTGQRVQVEEKKKELKGKRKFH